MCILKDSCKAIAWHESKIPDDYHKCVPADTGKRIKETCIEGEVLYPCSPQACSSLSYD